MLCFIGNFYWKFQRTVVFYLKNNIINYQILQFRIVLIISILPHLKWASFKEQNSSLRNFTWITLFLTISGVQVLIIHSTVKKHNLMMIRFHLFWKLFFHYMVYFLMIQVKVLFQINYVYIQKRVPSLLYTITKYMEIFLYISGRKAERSYTCMMLLNNSRLVASHYVI